jgi:hypothetical protein
MASGAQREADHGVVAGAAIGAVRNTIADGANRQPDGERIREGGFWRGVPAVYPEVGVGSAESRSGGECECDLIRNGRE